MAAIFPLFPYIFNWIISIFCTNDWSPYRENVHVTSHMCSDFKTLAYIWLLIHLQQVK